MDTKTAFIIDDEESHRTFNALWMKKAGYDVSTFETVDDALIAMGATLDGKRITHPVDPARLPTVVITDNNTTPKGAQLYGTQLVEALKGSHCGAILATSDRIDPDMLSGLNPASIHVDKSKVSAKELPSIAQKAIERANPAPTIPTTTISGIEHQLAPGAGRSL